MRNGLQEFRKLEIVDAKRVKQPEITRRKVMTAAMRVFRVHGYQGASLNEIVAESGVTKGAFFHHFRSKQDIALAMLDEIEAVRVRKEWIAPIGCGADAVAAISAMLDQLWMECEKRPSSLAYGSTLWNMATEMASLDARFQEAASKIYGEWASAWEAALRRDEAEGRLIAQPDWRGLTWWLIESIEGAVAAARFHRDPQRLKFALERIAGALGGLRKTPSDPVCESGNVSQAAGASLPPHEDHTAETDQTPGEHKEIAQSQEAASPSKKERAKRRSQDDPAQMEFL